jgi:putative membrane protein
MVPMMFWYAGQWAFWQAGLMWGGMIVFWALLIWGIYALVNSSTGRPGRSRETGTDARLILDERLARGEIDMEEYRRLRDVISQDGPRTSPRTPASSGTASSSDSSAREKTHLRNPSVAAAERHSPR